MNLTTIAERLLAKLPNRLAERLFGGASKIPTVRRIMESEYEEMLASAPIARPSAETPVFAELPQQPIARGALIAEIAALA